MPRLTLEVSIEAIRELVRQLPPKELLALLDEVEEQAETLTMLKLAESGFREWDEAGEDIYDAAAEAR